MTDILTTYYGFVDHLTNATITDINILSDVSWGNDNFNPTGKEAWLDVYYVPVGVGSTTKDVAGSNQTGYLQISVNVPLVSETTSVNYDIKQMQIINDIMTAFTDNSVVEYNGSKISVSNSSIQAARKSSGWYVRDITINYIKFGE